jgi:DNA-binding NarL/FixJ family response regulator
VDRATADAREAVVVCVPQPALRRSLGAVWDLPRCPLVGLEERGSARVLAAAVTWNLPDDVETLHELSATLPEVPLMAVVAEIRRHQCTAALHAGAVSVVSGRLPAQHIAARLARLTSQEATLPAGAVRMMARQLRDADQLRAVIDPKALELLQMVADGLTVAEIGRRTHLTERTVYRHLRQVMEHLGVGSREAALVRAARLGLLRDACLIG